MNRKIIAFMLAGLLLSGLCCAEGRKTMTMEKNAGPSCNLSDEELKKTLSPEQYEVVRKNGTERPFKNAYWNSKERGVYVDIVSGEALFSSSDKFDSGTGWPSFTKPIADNTVKNKPDSTLGTRRTEVRSVRADSHLGHVFDDGPAPLGARYCINSAALRFVPVEKLAESGLGRYLFLFPQDWDRLGYKRAVFAAGCFWGTQAYFKKVKGVLAARVGYTGGAKANPTYEQVCTGATGHAESVELIYDPRVVSYERLLRHFEDIHDPTTPNRQGNDAGTQYRAAIFYTDAIQKKEAMEYIGKMRKSGRYSKPVVTEVVTAGVFYPAEEYHQEYLDKNPGGYCHINLGGAEKP